VFCGPQFGAQVGALGLVLHVHRSAQDHQAAVAVHVRLRVGLALEVDEAYAVAPSPDQRIERAQRLGGYVLEDEEARHGTILGRIPVACGAMVAAETARPCPKGDALSPAGAAWRGGGRPACRACRYV